MPTHSSDKENNRGASLLHIAEHNLDTFLTKVATSANEKRWRFFLLLTMAVLLSLLITPRQHFITANLKSGTIATADIRATQDYLIEDRPLTDKKRAEAEAAVPLVYVFDPHSALDVSRRFEKTLTLLRESRSRGEELSGEQLRGAVARELGVAVTPAEVELLTRIRSDQSFMSEVNRVCGRIFAHKIAGDARTLAHDRSHGILVLDQESKLEIAAGDTSDFIDVTAARELLDKMKVAAGDPREQETRKELFGKFVRANLTFDRELTEARKREARAAVRPVLFQVKRGEMIVRVGERITDEEARKLETIYESRNGINSLFIGTGIFGLVLLLFYFPYRFARKNIRKFQASNKDLLLLGLLTVCTFLTLKLAYIVSTAMGGAFPSVDTTDYYYLFPFAAAAILVRIILNSEVALVYCAICAPLVGIMFNNSLPVVVYSLLGGIVGAHGVRHCKDRGTIYIAGLKVSVVNVAMAVSFQIFNDNLFTMQTLYCALFALAGGIINAAIVTGTIPVIEALFHYTTDIKLLELANLNSPVLRELMVRAPGTYHHSVLVGNLVEAAAEAINANPLLARVAAYYHDIGKISKPLYFIENVGSGENRHDKLSASMSALILISHVKEGVELAREHRLGLPIINIIRQSHGTGLITFFYQKAKNLAAADGKTVDEREFRYPGPKPQTREAGLVLLADCVEAASRTLNDPTPARIQGMVQKIINNIFIDGQLDECELTLKNLHEIAKSFNLVLAGIHHHRIDYPEPAYKEKGSGAKKGPHDSDNEPPAAAPGGGEEPKKNGGEDLKRLGISR
jgi:putative nucleotidyltransferase with HDIG domain